jgi:hypothetical protein
MIFKGESDFLFFFMLVNTKQLYCESRSCYTGARIPVKRAAFVLFLNCISQFFKIVYFDGF